MKKMNKRIFITGEAKITSLLRDYISARMEADFNIVNDYELNYESRRFLLGADVIILLHELGRCSLEEAQRNIKLTEAIIKTLPQYVKNYTIAYFVPRQRGEEPAYDIKAQGEKIVQYYCDAGFSKAVLYRMPEVFGLGFDCSILDRLIDEGEVQDTSSSYEFLYSEEFLDELYRMANGAPAMTGYMSYAQPNGIHHSTEAALLKRINGFKALSKNQIPDFPSPFERQLYSYYLIKEPHTASCSLNDGTIIASPRFGALDAVRLAQEEEYTIALHNAGGVRLFLLCGSVKIGRKTYCADKDIVRIDIAKDTSAKNVGSTLAVLEVWNHTKS